MTEEPLDGSGSAERDYAVDELQADQPEEAAAYWASVNPYVQRAPWSERIADVVAALEPGAVLEFGANAGRNLVAIRDRLPDARLIGLDINAKAAEEGRQRWGLDLRVGGVSNIPGIEVDVAFTVSVIDHLPDPIRAVRNLARAAPRLVLWEPWIGREGKLTTWSSRTTADSGAVTPYSYSWDYWRLAREADLDVLMVSEIEMETHLGPYYRVFHLGQKW